jgi:hypothetical protein
VAKGPLKVNKAQLERIHDYAATFSTPHGERVLEDLEAEYGGQCYVRGDIHETLRRTVNRDMLDRIKYMVSLPEIGLEIEEEQEEEGNA